MMWSDRKSFNCSSGTICPLLCHVLIYVNQASSVVAVPEQRAGSIRLVSSLVCEPLRFLSDCRYLMFAQVCLLILIKAQKRPGSAFTPYTDQILAVKCHKKQKSIPKRAWMLYSGDLFPNYF